MMKDVTSECVFQTPSFWSLRVDMTYFGSISRCWILLFIWQHLKFGSGNINTGWNILTTYSWILRDLVIDEQCLSSFFPALVIHFPMWVSSYSLNDGDDDNNDSYDVVRCFILWSIFVVDPMFEGSDFIGLNVRIARFSTTRYLTSSGSAANQSTMRRQQKYRNILMRVNHRKSHSKFLR